MLRYHNKFDKQLTVLILMSTDKIKNKKKPSILALSISILKSVLAASFGVQSNKQRLNDFQNGNPIHFIIASIVFTILFVSILIGVVHLVLP